VFYLVTLIMCLAGDAFSGPVCVLIWVMHSVTTPSLPDMSHNTLCRCGRKKPNPSHLVCAPCWKSTPIPLRSAVLRARQADAGGPEHRAAIRAVFTHLNTNQPS
jgi:hypothetical protein